MKISVLKIGFCILFLAFILGMFGIAELLVQVINMNTVMKICYAVLGYSFIYLIKD